MHQVLGNLLVSTDCEVVFNDDLQDVVPAALVHRNSIVEDGVYCILTFFASSFSISNSLHIVMKKTKEKSLSWNVGFRGSLRELARWALVSN